MDLRADVIWQDAKSGQQPFGLLMLDIDNFKKYNDRYGHQSGDECLRQVARAIDIATAEANGDGITENAFAARYGGEEFAVIVPQASAQALLEVANSIVKTVRGLGIAHEPNDAWGVVTISVGGAQISAAQGEIVNLFRQADARLYQAKAQGRNRAVVD